MAKKYYDKEIDKHVDWGGDETTGGMPVKGNRVQEFIKNTFNSKHGYCRIADNKFLEQFADEASALLYDEDPIANENLLLAHVQLPNTGATIATMKITVKETPSEYTTSGTKEVFSFIYLSYYDDISDLSSVRGKATVNINNIQKQTLELRSGNTYSIDLTNYLTSEVNEVQITVTNNEGSTRNYVYTVNIVELSVSSTFDDTTAYSGDIEFRYTPIGNLLKTIHFKINGEEIGTVETDVSNRQQSYNIPKKAHGVYILEVYATAEIYGLSIKSNVLKYAIIFVEEDNMTPIIASTFSFDSIQQYDTISIPFVVYNPAGSPTDIELWVNDSRVAERSVDRTKQYWTYRVNDKGHLKMEIRCGEVSKVFEGEITESSITSVAETQNLELYLTSQGRSNQDINRDEWKYNNIVSVLKGFNWVSNGWITDDSGSVCMRVSGGATVAIPYKIFSKDIRITGCTIELEFAVRNVTDYTSSIISCMNGVIGFNITANDVLFTSEQSKMETRYKEDERVRLSFVVEKQADNRLMNIYINGIKSKSIQYPATDGFIQGSPADIAIGTHSATVDVYNIRVYSNNLNALQLLDNYIADMDNIDSKILLFNRNQVYDSYGNLSYDKLLTQIPIMTIIGDLPQYKGDKKTVKVEYVDLTKPEKCFTAEGCSINVQGTSSQYYPRKNYKIDFKKGFDMTNGGHEDAFTLNEEACLPASIFCTKADFAESSGTHNTGMANYVDWLTKQAGILTEPQQGNEKIRTTVYGEPCLIFHKDSEEDTAEFIGKYNFNTDKGAENTFGFEEGDESWEFLNNTSDRSLFRSADFSGEGWKDDFEARYPEDYTDVSKMSKVFEWVVSCKGNTEKFKSELSSYFDKEQLIFYYLITEVFGMVDQRAKNQFLTTFGNNWLFIFYDNDTWCGINNEGAIAFSYNIEIHDNIGSLAVWNGADSELWKLVEDAFSDDIQQMYYNLRQQGLLSYDKIIEYTNERQSSKWCEAVYNEDGYFKYEQPLIDGYYDWSSGSAQLVKTGAYLYALQGSRDEYRKWWLYNRFKYLDSKYQAGSSLSDYMTFRTYTPAEWSGVSPNADITIKSFTAMYGTIKWGSVTKSERLGEGETKTIEAPEIQFNDTETIIYNASMIASIGDLSPLYVGTVDVSKAINLTELIIGNSTSGYKNTNFNVLSVGNNKVLRKLDITNCPNFTSNIELSGCEAIEEVYAKGTGTTAVNLAEGSAIRIMQLPASITNLTLKNQPNLSSENLTFEGTSNLIAFSYENTPGVNAYTFVRNVLASSNSLARIRMIGIDATDSNLDFLNTLSKLSGIDEKGLTIPTAVITGNLHVSVAGEENYNRLKELFPNLNITYDTFKPIPTFTITVLDNSTSSPIIGAEVTINDQEYTTDDSGIVSVKTSQEVKCVITAEGYKSKTQSYSASEDDRNITIRLDKSVRVKILVTDIYNQPIEGVTVTCADSEGVSDSEGVVYFDLIKGSYSANASYNDTTKSVAVKINGDEVLPEFELTGFPRNIEESKPDENGNIQLLVRSDTSGSVMLYIETSSPCKIDWGDDSELEEFSDLTSNTSGTSITKSISHTYSNKNHCYQVEILECEGVTNLNCWSAKNGNYNSSDRTSMQRLIAYWSIGNSKIHGLQFGSSQGKYYGAYYLEFISDDIFKNDEMNNLTEYRYTLNNVALKEPIVLVNSKTTNVYGILSYSNIERLPSSIFERCSEIIMFTLAFAYCTSLIEAWFPHGSDKVTNWAYLFQNCSKLQTVLLKQETPPNIDATVFTGCSALTSIYVPDDSVELYKQATNWNTYADIIKPISEYGGDLQ